MKNKQNINEMWPFSTSNLYHPDAMKKVNLKDLERRIYKSINSYRDMLLDASKQQGDADDNIHHDVIRKDQEHRSIVKFIAQLFAQVYDYEKGSTKLKPSFFSDTVFEKVARHAKNKLGYHADEIADHLRQSNPASLEDLYNIWRPGSWTGMRESVKTFSQWLLEKNESSVTNSDSW
jgi:hypothetical protein